MVDVPEGHDAMIVKGKTRKAICKSVTTPDGESADRARTNGRGRSGEPMLGEQRRTTRTQSRPRAIQSADRKSLYLLFLYVVSSPAGSAE